METGGLCVMTDGQPLMLMWPVDSLGTLALVMKEDALVLFSL